MSLMSPHWQTGSLPLAPCGKPHIPAKSLLVIYPRKVKTFFHKNSLYKNDISNVIHKQLKSLKKTTYPPTDDNDQQILVYPYNI